MLTLKPKQKLAVDAINDPVVDTLVLIGTVGTGKTDVAAHIVISACHAFPKSRWPVFRGNLSTAQETVIPSYLDMLDRMDFVRDKDYIYREKPFFIKFNNGSQIRFREADPSKDPGGKKVKGINATGNHIDEADELTHEMFIQATSRKGRKNDLGQPSVSIVTLNPTDAEHFVKIYDNYKAGKLPPNVRVIEFGIEDSWQSKEDIAALMENPVWWVERYMNNNWHYKDESKTLFKSHIFRNALIPREQMSTGMKTKGYDVAREGNDRSVSADMEEFCLTNISVVKDNKETMETDDQARWIIEDCDINDIAYENVMVDGVGVGVGVLDSGKILGAKFGVYKSGFAPDPYLTFDGKPPTKEQAEKNNQMLSFNNLRSQMAYMFARGMERGSIKILDSCPFYNELVREAQEHHFEVRDKVLILESKEKMKARLGRSPDVFDAVLMALYKQMKKQAVIEYGGVR